MKFKVKDKSFNDYGKEYDVKVIARYINGYKCEYKGEVAFIEKRGMEIIEISEEEANMPIGL